LINAATGRPISRNSAHCANPGIAIPNNRPASSADTPIITEKTNTKKALAKKKKKARHAHVVPAPRADAKRYRRSTNAPRSGTSTSTQYNATANITPERVNLPTVPPMDITLRTQETTTNVAPASPPMNDEPTHMECEAASLDVTAERTNMQALDELHGAGLLQHSSALTSSAPPFTTSTTTPNASSHLMPPTSGAALSGKPQGFARVPPTEQDNILAALERRADIETRALGNNSSDRLGPAVYADAYLSCDPTAVTAVDRVQVGAIGRLLSYGPNEIVFTKLLEWCRQESARILKAKTSEANKEYVSSLVPSSSLSEQALDTPNDMAVERYHPPSMVALKAVRVFSRSCSTTSSSACIWDAERIFFVAQSGHTRLVDRTQALYNVEVLMDDGGSDFDSIASPIKVDPRFASLHMTENLSYSTLSDSSSSASELDDDLADLYQLECRFLTTDCDEDRELETPDTTLSISSDKDIIDPLLVFRKFEPEKFSVQKLNEYISIYVRPECNTEDCKSMDRDTREAIGSELTGSHVDRRDLSLTSSSGDLHYDAMVEVDSRELVVHAGHSHAEPSGQLPDHMPVEIDREYSDIEYDCDLTLVDTGGLSQVDTAYIPVHRAQDDYAPYSTRLDTTYDGRDTTEVRSETFPSDWASELVRTTLGTESLFTFFQHLATDDKGTTTKAALASTFLVLVNLEREKLKEHALPKSYIASTVLASQIVPHTIFLGTTSLASLLSRFSFDGNHEMAVSEVYRVFRELRKEDLRFQLMATTGVMGELGRCLGKLPAL
jgi:hypothetical protein